MPIIHSPLRSWSTACLSYEYQQPVPSITRSLRAGIFAVVAAACLTAVASAQSLQVQEEFKRGALALHNDRNAEAEAAFRHAIQLAPDLAEAHLDLGLVLGKEAKLDEAIAELRRTLLLDGSLNSAHMFLGIFLHQANRQAEAQAELEREVSDHPSNAEALTWLGMVDMAQGHAEAAAAVFDRAATLTPDDLNVLEYRGRAHSLVAQDSYRRMARLDPGSWHVHRVQAMLFSEQNRHTDAIAEYLSAIQIEQRDPDMYEGLGDEYRSANQMEAARSAYKRELELSPANPIALYNLGSTEIEMGDPAAGVPRLEAMLRTYAAPPVAAYYLGRGLAALSKNDEAVSWLKKSAAADHEGEVAKRSFYELARLYRKLQRPEDAAKSLADYNHLREAQERKKSQEVEDWRRLSHPQ